MVGPSDIGARDARIQRLLRSYGTKVGQYPAAWSSVSSLLLLAVFLAGWIPRWSGKHFWNQDEMQLQWSITGGRLEKDLKRFIREHGVTHPDYQKPESVTMFVGKGEHAGKDILTKDALVEMYGLLELYRDLWVVIEGKNGMSLNYTMWDLCDRGFLPDIPGVTVVLPCTDVNFMHCFREQKDLLHESYAGLDEIVDTIPAFASSLPLPYSTRPSFNNLTDEQIKKEVFTLHPPREDGNFPDQNRGCLFWTQTITWYSHLWSSIDLEYTRNVDGDMQITKLPGFRSIMTLDGPERIRYRMSLDPSKENHRDLDNIIKARAALSAKYQETCVEYNKKTRILEVANLEDYDHFTGEALEDELEQVKWGYLIAGIVLMNIFVTITTISFKHPFASRAGAAGLGLLIILFAQGGSFGLFFYFGSYLNGPLMIAMPLLALGLGVDDMFVLLRYFSRLGYGFISAHSSEEIIGEVFARAGPGTTLTSACNILVFVCGYFLPIQGMSAFCLCGAFVALTNYMTTMNIFMPSLVLEIARIKQKRPELSWSYSCHKRAIADGPEADLMATCADEYPRGFSKDVNKMLKNKIAPVLTGVVGRTVASLLALIFFGVTTYLIFHKEIGYAPAELFATDDPANRAMDLVFNKFGLFPGYLCFHDIDAATHQEDMLTLLKKLTDNVYGADQLIPNYLTWWYGFLYLGAMAAIEGNTSLLVPTLQAMGFADAGAALTNPEYNLKTYMPFGAFSREDPRVFNELFTAHRRIPEPVQAYNTTAHAQLFHLMDLARVNEFTYESSVGYEKTRFSFFPFFVLNLNKEDKYVEAIEHKNKVIAESPLKDNAFVYGPISTYWEVFLELDRYMWLLFGIGAGIIFLMTLMAFSIDVVTALITSLACFMITLEIYGLSCALMNFNFYVASISLLGLGLSVEFTAHLAAAFSMGSGPPAERVSSAIAHTFPAIFEGSISTLLSVLPLAFHPMLFIVKYLFGIISLVVAIGLINGVVFMPALLAVLSPLFTMCGHQKDSDPVTAQLPSGQNPAQAAVPDVLPTVLHGSSSSATTAEKKEASV